MGTGESSTSGAAQEDSSASTSMPGAQQRQDSTPAAEKSNVPTKRPPTTQRASTSRKNRDRSPSPYRSRAGQETNDFLREFWQHNSDIAENADGDFKRQSLPLARIKKVMRSDPEVKMISSEVTVLFEKACQIFISELTARAHLVSLDARRRTLARADIAQAISKSDMFDFLIDIVPREEGWANSLATSVDSGDGGTASAKKGKSRARSRANSSVKGKEKLSAEHGSAEVDLSDAAGDPKPHPSVAGQPRGHDGGAVRLEGFTGDENDLLAQSADSLPAFGGVPSHNGHAGDDGDDDGDEEPANGTNTSPSFLHDRVPSLQDAHMASGADSTGLEWFNQDPMLFSAMGHNGDLFWPGGGEDAASQEQ